MEYITSEKKRAINGSAMKDFLKLNIFAYSLSLGLFLKNI